jgi:hydrogenase maturation protein HypF
MTSSIGRLFDAVASLAGLRQVVSYEAQAAIELEAMIDPTELGAYKYTISTNAKGGETLIDPHLVIQAAAEDSLRRIHPSIIAARFHNATTKMIIEICSHLRMQYSISRVVLSGGVWQNMALLSASSAALIEAGFSVNIHQRVPTNDGGISLGQAAIAGALNRSQAK